MYTINKENLPCQLSHCWYQMVEVSSQWASDRSVKETSVIWKYNEMTKNTFVSTMNIRIKCVQSVVLFLFTLFSSLHPMEPGTLLTVANYSHILTVFIFLCLLLWWMHLSNDASPEVTKSPNFGRLAQTFVEEVCWIAVLNSRECVNWPLAKCDFCVWFCFVVESGCKTTGLKKYSSGTSNKTKVSKFALYQNLF